MMWKIIDIFTTIKKCYNAEGRFCRYSIDEIMKRDKLSLDIFWIKDKSLADLENLPPADELADDIIEKLQSVLESFM